MRPSAQRCLPYPGNTLPDPWRISRRQRCSTFGFTSNARATSPIELPRSSRCTAASLNSLVNILLDNPLTHSPFQWILSLNWLCQKWGQVHRLTNPRTHLTPATTTGPVTPDGARESGQPWWLAALGSGSRVRQPQSGTTLLPLCLQGL